MRNPLLKPPLKLNVGMDLEVARKMLSQRGPHTQMAMSDKLGGKYKVELFSSTSARPIRSVSVRVASTERTPVMRGRCDARWDMAVGTLDLLVDGRPELRLYFKPAKDLADTDSG